MVGDLFVQVLKLRSNMTELWKSCDLDQDGPYVRAATFSFNNVRLEPVSATKSNLTSSERLTALSLAQSFLR